MSTDSDSLGAMVEAHLAGQAVDVPADLQASFAEALAAHAALEGLLDATVLAGFTADETPPVIPPGYELESELGRGGMGIVYLVRHQALGRRVALKLLRPGEQSRRMALNRFFDEARHLASLRHPNIVSIHEVGQADGEPFFTMDYIDGESLAQILRNGCLTPSRAVDIVRQVALGIQYAHRQGIIHRDLKPANVLVDRSGQVFVTDFGLARNTQQDSNLTRTGELLGTPQYMAPEQACGQAGLVGESTDIHALGLLLFETLTGRPAYLASSPAEVLVKILDSEVPSPRQSDRRIPRDLETICLKCLQKSPGARYANVSAVLEDLRRYEAGESLTARRPSWAHRLGHWFRRRWALVTTACVTALLVLVLVAPAFNRSFEDLVAWGDEELASGHAEIAGQVYTRAFQRGTLDQKRGLANRMARACRLMTDSRAAVELALLILDVVPEESFGERDWLVAQALIAKERPPISTGANQGWRDRPPAVLERIKLRLNRALANASQTMTDEQRRDAEESLSALQTALADGQPWVRYVPDYLYELPKGTPEELEARMQDVTAAAWDRGKAAFVLGQRNEQAGDPTRALQCYRQAYDWIQSVYPMYSGVKAASGAARREDAPDAEECRIVRDVAGALQRLAPREWTLPRGALRINVRGVPLPTSMDCSLQVELCAPSIVNPNEGLPHNLPRLIPLPRQGTTQAQVLDGRYRLTFRGHQANWQNDDEATARRLQIGPVDWPDQVAIQGQTVDLTVETWLATEIQLKSPTEGLAVKLAELELAWNPIPGAQRYQIQLMSLKDGTVTTVSYFLTVESPEPRLRISALPEPERLVIRENLRVGSLGSCRIEALDKTGRRVGVTLAERRFLVAED